MVLSMTSKRLSTFFEIALAALVFCVWAAGGPRLREAVENLAAHRAGSIGEQDLRQRNESAFAQILGEARASMGDILFVKTNRYLHAGIGYAPRLNTTSGDDSRMFSSCTPGTPTLIRSKQSDFRGFLGSLERAVKPYAVAGAAHVHLGPDELTPWYRVITLVNPQHIRAYRIGAKALGDAKKWEEALDFLKEGIRLNRQNPELFLLYQSLASFHMRGRFHKDYPWGDSWVDNAKEAATKGYEAALPQRPAQGQTNKIHKDILWTDDHEEDFRYCAHMIGLLLREQGRRAEALAWAQKAVVECPGFSPLLRLQAELRREAQAGREPEKPSSLGGTP